MIAPMEFNLTQPQPLKHLLAVYDLLNVEQWSSSHISQLDGQCEQEEQAERDYMNAVTLLSNAQRSSNVVGTAAGLTSVTVGSTVNSVTVQPVTHTSGPMEISTTSSATDAPATSTAQRSTGSEVIMGDLMVTVDGISTSSDLLAPHVIEDGHSDDDMHTVDEPVDERIVFVAALHASDDRRSSGQERDTVEHLTGSEDGDSELDATGAVEDADQDRRSDDDVDDAGDDNHAGKSDADDDDDDDGDDQLGDFVASDDDDDVSESDLAGFTARRH